jgi:hypothetical protein
MAAQIRRPILLVTFSVLVVAVAIAIYVAATMVLNVARGAT